MHVPPHAGAAEPRLREPRGRARLRPLAGELDRQRRAQDLIGAQEVAPDRAHDPGQLLHVESGGVEFNGPDGALADAPENANLTLGNDIAPNLDLIGAQYVTPHRANDPGQLLHVESGGVEFNGPDGALADAPENTNLTLVNDIAPNLDPAAHAVDVPAELSEAIVINVQPGA